MPTVKETKRIRRHLRVRKVVKGTASRPRLTVKRSLTNTYAQLIDDDASKTLAASSSMKIEKGTKLEKAKEVGLEIAKKAKELKITEAVFDRSGHKYHGRVKAIAEGAREGGLTI